MRHAPERLRAVLAFALMIGPACRHAGLAAGEDSGAGAGDADAAADLMGPSAETPDATAEDVGAGGDSSGEAGSSDAAGGDATAALGCGCPAGDYWIEVKSDTGSPVVVDELLRAPYVQQPVEPTCVPAVPWAFYNEPTFSLYGCKTGDQSRSCLRVSNGIPDEGIYLGSAGERSTLVHPPVITDFVRGDGRTPPMVVTGTYTADAVRADGIRWSLHGAFRICVSTRRLLLF